MYKRQVQKILVVDHLGLNEAPLKIGVDLSCGLGSLGAYLNGPGAGLLFTGSQIADEA